jgi:hypothetical protein
MALTPAYGRSPRTYDHADLTGPERADLTAERLKLIAGGVSSQTETIENKRADGRGHRKAARGNRDGAGRAIIPDSRRIRCGLGTPRKYH